MAFIQLTYFATSLMKLTTFHMYLPNEAPANYTEGNRHYDRPTKTLYLLHGFSGNTIDWVTGSLAQEVSLKYNIAIVMPSGDNSFYLDAKGTGHAYGTFVGKDIVDYVSRTFNLSKNKEDVFIGGLSMGGFGAIRTGLKYYDQFGKMFGLSSAMIIDDIKEMKPDEHDAIADYDYYEGLFGNLSELDNSENNPAYLVKQLKLAGKKIQPIYMACGTEDFLIENNHDFRDFLISEGVDVTYRESTGIHEWKFWNEYLEPAVKWLVEA